MTALTTIVDAGVSLASLVDDDELYQLAQGLLALSRPTGRRDVQLRRRRSHWELVGVTDTALEYPPRAVGLGDTRPHQTHLRAMRQMSLAVEVPSARAGDGPTYVVSRRGVSTLVDALAPLAAALDHAQQAARSGWWGRARRVEAAEQAVARCRTALRSAAAAVSATRTWDVALN